MLPEHQPSREEKIFRFMFGFLAGLIVGILAWLKFSLTLELGLGATALAGLICGAAAVRYGDDFWRDFLKSLPWWG